MEGELVVFKVNSFIHPVVLIIRMKEKSLAAEMLAQYLSVMSLHKRITREGIYFITLTNHAWLPLIQLTNGYDLIYNWFDILKGKRHDLTGYVIMPNHLHLLLYYAGGAQPLNTLVGNGKRFIAYEYNGST
jgi:hypothetical protein